MFGLKEGLNDYNYDMCGMVSYTISDKNIRYRRYPCPISSVFDPRLSVFVFENIRIYIRIRSYSYSNSNPTKNMKTNMISLISVRIRSDYTHTAAASLSTHACMMSWSPSMMILDRSPPYVDKWALPESDYLPSARRFAEYFFSTRQRSLCRTPHSVKSYSR